MSVCVEQDDRMPLCANHKTINIDPALLFRPGNNQPCRLPSANTRNNERNFFFFILLKRTYIVRQHFWGKRINELKGRRCRHRSLKICESVGARKPGPTMSDGINRAREKPKPLTQTGRQQHITGVLDSDGVRGVNSLSLCLFFWPMGKSYPQYIRSRMRR